MAAKIIVGDKPMHKKMLKIKKVNIRYPFSKIRVYFNAIFGSIAFILSLTLLISYTDTPLVSAYIATTIVLITLATKLKICVLKRLERIQSEQEEGEEGGLLSWRLIVMIILLCLALLLPVITAPLANPLWWFFGFSSFVVGFSLSEVLLYACTEH